jgi:selenocysteine-specific elongation factor
VVHLPGYRVHLNAGQQAKVDSFIEGLNKSPHAPPGDLVVEPDLLNVLIEQRRVVKVSNDVVFDASTYDKMVDGIIARLKAQGKITVAEVRDMFHTSRKYALALMEYLDEQKITRRVGDERVLR